MMQFPPEIGNKGHKWQMETWNPCKSEIIAIVDAIATYLSMNRDSVSLLVLVTSITVFLSLSWKQSNIFSRHRKVNYTGIAFKQSAMLLAVGKKVGNPIKISLSDIVYSYLFLPEAFYLAGIFLQKFDKVFYRYIIINGIFDSNFNSSLDTLLILIKRFRLARLIPT